MDFLVHAHRLRTSHAVLAMPARRMPPPQANAIPRRKPRRSRHRLPQPHNLPDALVAPDQRPPCLRRCRRPAVARQHVAVAHAAHFDVD